MARYAIAHCGTGYTGYTVCRFSDCSRAVSYVWTIRNGIDTWTNNNCFALRMTEEEAREHAEQLTFNERINAAVRP